MLAMILASTAFAADWAPAPDVVWPAVDDMYGDPVAGDFDADGTPELAWIGVFEDVVHVYELGQAGQPAVLAHDLHAIHGLAVGDVNCDGVDDLVGVGSADATLLFVQLGSPAGLLDPVVLEALEPNNRTLTPVGDPNGDGCADLSLGLDLWMGSASAPYLVAGRSFATEESASAGHVSGIGDIDQDGYDDLLVPDWSVDMGWYAVTVGGASAYLGGPLMDTADPLWTLEPPEGEQRAVGGTVARLDHDGDGVDEIVTTSEYHSACWTEGDVLVLDDLGRPEGPAVVASRTVDGMALCSGIELLTLRRGGPSGAALLWVADELAREVSVSPAGLELTDRTWEAAGGSAGVRFLVHDLDGDGIADLAATWNFVYMLSEPAEITAATTLWLSTRSPEPTDSGPSDSGEPIVGDDTDDGHAPRRSSGGCGCSASPWPSTGYGALLVAAIAACQMRARQGAGRPRLRASHTAASAQ